MRSWYWDQPTWDYADSIKHSLGFDSQLSRGNAAGDKTQFGIIRKAALYWLCRRRHNQYLYCHPGPDGKLIHAKYFGKVRDDIELAECSVPN